MGTPIRTQLQETVQQYEERIGGKWKPDQRFYKKVAINRKRFGMLLRGELELYAFEVKNLCHFFEVPVTNFF